MNNMQRILDKCPSLLNVKDDALDLAVARMVIAHVANGGVWLGFEETALAYLASLEGITS